MLNDEKALPCIYIIKIQSRLGKSFVEKFDAINSFQTLENIIHP